MGAQLDQRQLAHLGEGAVAPPAVGPAEGPGVGVGVGHVQHGAVDADQAQALVGGAGQRGAGQRPRDAVEQAAHRRHPQALAGAAQGGPLGGLLAPAQAAGVAEHLAQRQVGEDAHGQDQPQQDLVGQHAVLAVAPAGLAQDLLDGLVADKLLQAGQPVQFQRGDSPRHLRTSVALHRHSLPEPWLVLNPSYQGAVTCALGKRYCG